MSLSAPLLSAVLVLSQVSLAETDSLAFGEERPKDVVLDEGEVHEGWFFAAGDRAIIRGIVNGDAYVVGGTVEVDGEINGDLLVAGGNVTLRGSVTDDIRACGGTLRIDGNVGKDVSACGGKVEVGSPSLVEGNILAIGRTISVGGVIKKKARLAARQIRVAGTIEDNANLAAENIAVVKGARFVKGLTVRILKRENVQIAEGAVVGKLTIHVREEDPERIESRILGMSRYQFWFKVYWILSLLAIGLVFALALPDQMYAVGQFIWGEPLKSILWGLIGLVVGPVLILAVCITVIGLPLGLFLLVVYFWLLYLTQLSLAIVLAHLIFPVAEKQGLILFGAFAVGLMIIQGLMLIPVLETVVVLVGLVMGMGSFVLLIMSEYDRVRGV